MPKTTPPVSFPKLDQVFPYILIVCSVLALISSFILSQDELALAKNPSFTPNCNLNPVLSCGSVIRTHQAAIFGFPNPWIGLTAFSVFLTFGIALLAGANVKRWFWIALEAGLALAMVFAYWLLVQSVFVIQALCPYCLLVDVALTIMFWYTTLYVILNRHIVLPTRFQGTVAFARRHHAEILITWFLLLLALVLQHFWYYYGQFI